MVPTLRLCVLYGFQNKQQLLPYKTLKRLVFKTEVENVYSAVCTESLYKTHTFRLQRVKSLYCYTIKATPYVMGRTRRTHMRTHTYNFSYDTSTSQDNIKTHLRKTRQHRRGFTPIGLLPSHGFTQSHIHLFHNYSFLLPS
jgi:hypothetical protein